MLVTLLLGALKVLSGREVPASVASDDPGYVLHEWGTFTTVAGSDGVLLEGLAYDDHQLPDFVHRRSACAPGFEGVRCKMETPVIYFYSDRARELRVKVGFQQGLLTQWYPQVHELRPPAGPGPAELRGGVLDWGRIRVLAPGEGVNLVPPVGRAFHWEHARAVDANVIQGHAAGEQHERFLFYRGLGSFALSLSVWIDGHGALHLSSTAGEPPAGAIVLARDGRSLRAKRLGAFPLGRPARVAPDELEPIDVEGLMGLTARMLEEQGLYPKEARAMVATWRESYFESEGLRVLYPLSRAEVDWILPLAVSPAPRESVRVLVGRVDVLTPQAEQAALAALPRLRTADQAREHLGRFALPLLRRLGSLAQDEREREHVRELARLLEQSL